MSDIEKDLASENQRLRERVAELEAHIRKGDEFIGAVERAEKAERERDEVWRRFSIESDESLLECVERTVNGWRQRAEKAEAEVAMLREALADMEDACAQVASWCVESIEYSDAVRVAARAALAATSGDWLAAHDRALAERVREAVLGKPMDLPKDNAAWCTSCLENIHTAVEVRANALDLDVLVGGES